MKKKKRSKPVQFLRSKAWKELEKLLDKVVKSSLMGLFTANKISRELHLGRTWTFRDQPTGFCFSKESRALLEEFNMNMPQYKRELRIED